jgi:carbamoyl-phosphate synthase large subunit
MPRRDDLHTILVIGSGPIVIGQAGEFDYSGTQACSALRDEGYRVVLANPNPASIMTDPQIADRTYVEPLDITTLTRIIAAERPDALLPTLGGQTALNTAMALHEAGVLAAHGVALIGADAETIRRAEDREVFRTTMRDAGIPVLDALTATSLADGAEAARRFGYPLILRPAFTLGGEGGGVAPDVETLDVLLARGLTASPIGQVLIEPSIRGWAEIELEVVRDRADNAIVVCSIENLDPMGVHTGDSVTVAPAMTLTDTELQRLRDIAIQVLRVVGVETGGSNVQFALNRRTGEVVVIEMNPRVSRSSALASKATGFPIARVAAKLAVGYTLDELPNEITAVTPASFEPALDYVAVKVPRFAFEKVGADAGALTTAMQSVGEVLALGRTFAEALGKALGARELDVPFRGPGDVSEALRRLQTPSWDRWDLMLWAARQGAEPEALHAATNVDPWFCHEIDRLANACEGLPTRLGELRAEDFRAARTAGATDADLARHAGVSEREIWEARNAAGVHATFHAVDTCAGEFAAQTPYFYGAFASPSESRRRARESVIVLGSGPNRIGQGIEFDYCCVHAAQALRDLGYDAVMVNCNPETVSTDHGVSDRLYLEPVTLGAVLDICADEAPRGVITQLGGQTPLRLARELLEAGVPVLGTQPDAIDLAEDRERFATLASSLGIQLPRWRIAHEPAEAATAADEVGYPVLVRPSYVLGGRAMAVLFTPDDLAEYLEREQPVWPLAIDQFLEDAIELDVDALCDGSETRVVAVLEHVEAAGVHSGDSACVIPPQETGPGVVADIIDQTAALGRALGAVGLLNVQFAVHHQELMVLEANPRASRTVPFVGKATGLPVVRAAVELMLGTPLAEVALPEIGPMRHVAVKEAVLPFRAFPNVDPRLGPEMRATGEVMAIGRSFAEAFGTAQRAAGAPLPESGTVVISTGDRDKPRAVAVAQSFARAGFRLLATQGTAAAIRAAGIAVTAVAKVAEWGDDIPTLIACGEVDLVINTPSGRVAQDDRAAIRRAASRASLPCLTTMEAAEAAAQAVRISPGPPRAIQDVVGTSLASTAERSTSS